MIFHRPFLSFFIGFQILSQSSAIRGGSRSLKGEQISAEKATRPPTATKSPKGVAGAEAGAASPCAATPPSLSGGCDLNCQLTKAAQAGAETIVGEIPVVGSLVSNLVGAFWPSGTDDVGTLLNDTVNYIDAMVAQAESDTLDTVIDGYYATIANEMAELSYYISVSNTTNNTSQRHDKLKSIISDCELAYGLFQAGSSKISSAALLSALANVGQVCIGMRVVEAYHYYATVGENGADDHFEELDQWVTGFTT
jgi:hypothetical protein